MSGFDPASLRFRMNLEKPAGSPDGQGGRLRGFEPVASLLAAIESRDSETVTESGSTMLIRRFTVTIRFRGDIRPGWRLTGDGRVLLVTGLFEPDAHRRLLVLEAEDRT